MNQSIPKYQSFFQYLLYTKPFRAPGFLIQKIKHRGFDNKKSVLLNMRLGHKIELSATQPYLQRVIWNRAYHDDGVFYLEPYLKPGAVILDIGANIGLLTCAYAERFKHLRPTIYAIEAVEQNFRRLVRNIDLNGFNNIRPFRLALGKENGTLNFKLPSKEFSGNAVGTNVLSEKDVEELNSKSTYEEQVTLTTLNDWAHENEIERCDFLKIDIEGAELFVFQGGKEFIQKTRPIIQCEFNKYWLEQQNFGILDFLKFFQDLNYSCFVDEDKKFTPLDVKKFNKPLVDLLFVPKEKIRPQSF